MILDGRLYDVKTTLEPRRDLPFRVRQLVGYCLLDCTDATVSWTAPFALEAVGFYFSRQAKWISWPLPELIRRTTGDAGATLERIRGEFRARAHRDSLFGGAERRRRTRKPRRSSRKRIRRSET